MKEQQQKWYWLGGGIAVVVLLIIVGIMWPRRGHDAGEPETVTEVSEKKKKRISAPQNLLPLDERPVVSLQPFGKDGGRFVSIVVSTVPRTAASAEYEIVYNVIGASAVDAAGKPIKTPAGEEEGGLQAFVGELDLSRLPTSTQNRFGTCSAGGACINNNVDYGTLTLNFDASEKYGVNTNWTYFETGAATSQTHDGNFTITAAALADSDDYLILQTIGLPAGVPGEVVMLPDGGKDGGSWPLAFQLSFTKAPADLDEASVDFGSNSGDGVAVYDGRSWQRFELGEEVPAGADYIYALVSQAGTAGSTLSAESAE